VLVWLALALSVAAPNLLWYKAVREVMMPEAAPVTLVLEKN
jgi:hypothetical protein